MTFKQFRGMPLKAKGKYILKTGIWNVLLAVYVVALLGTWIYQDVMQEPPRLSVEMVDGAEDAPEGEAFRDFMRSEGLNAEENPVRVSKLIQLETPSWKPRNLTLCMALATRVTDVYFWDDLRSEQYLAHTQLMDLRKILPASVLEANLDRLIFNKPVLSGGYPCGIRLPDCPFIQENGFYEQCSAGVSVHAKDPELAAALLQYLLENQNS